ncbi:MAG: PfkB family carbohydrate kinase, partial [Pseudomonadota bacterium]|nr:PfkB family carbohydrate kinase [Pseudomonadota bacterium]
MTYSIPPFNSVHVLIVGDVMLDQYWYGPTARISPEAPVPVVHIQQQQQRPGGAGNVALNIAALGSKVTLIGVTGIDQAADILVNQLSAQGVHCAFLHLANVSTISKLRVLSQNQQLIRLDFEDVFTGLDPQALMTKMQIALAVADSVILSDYGKGTLADIPLLIDLAHKAGKPVLIDPKGRAFTKYRGATVLTPNLAEFEAVVGECATLEQLVTKGEQLRQQLQLEALLITRSQHGMSLLRSNYPPLHLPAHAR